MEIIKFILLVYGITFFLQHKTYSLLSKVPFFKKMLECTFCTGFHGGWIAFLLLVPPAPFLRLSIIVEMIVAGFIGAASSYIVDTLISKLEEYGSR